MEKKSNWFGRLAPAGMLALVALVFGLGLAACTTDDDDDGGGGSSNFDSALVGKWTGTTGSVEFTNTDAGVKFEWTIGTNMGTAYGTTTSDGVITADLISSKETVKYSISESTLTLSEGTGTLASLNGTYTKEGGSSGDDTTPPADVTSLTATAGDAQVSLSWTNPTDTDFAKVEITHNKTGGNTAATVNKGTAAYTWTGLTNGTEYTFTVKAVDTAGNKSSGVTKNATPAASSSGGDDEPYADSPILGTWERTVTMYGISMTVTFTFNADGTVTINIGGTPMTGHTPRRTILSP